MALTRRERLQCVRDVLICTLNVFFARLYPLLQPSRDIDLSRKTAIITGGNSGIGLQLAIDLVRQQCRVILACRDVEKGRIAVEKIRAATGVAGQGCVRVVELDLASNESIRAFARTWRRSDAGVDDDGGDGRGDGYGKIDFVFHNAGIPQSQGRRSVDGVDLIYATNFLGSFVLTALLEEHLADDARIIFTSAAGQFAGKIEKLFAASPSPSPPPSSPSSTTQSSEPQDEKGQGLESKDHQPQEERFGYVDTKLMQCVFAHLLQLRWREKGFTDRYAHAFTPGYVHTAILDGTEVQTFKENPALYMIKHWTWLAVSPEQGTATGFWLATTEDARVVGENAGGAFWDRMVERINKARAYDREMLGKVWSVWERDGGVSWA